MFDVFIPLMNGRTHVAFSKKSLVSLARTTDMMLETGIAAMRLLQCMTNPTVS
jgi:hypothetical protein